MNSRPVVNSGSNFPEDSKSVMRSSFMFMDAASREPNVDELNRSNNSPVHPLELFKVLQDENPWVDLSVRVIASACANTTPLFRVEGNKKTKTKVDQFVRKLTYPNPIMTGYELFYQTYADLVIYGNSYWQIIKNKRGELHSIYHIPAYQMRVNSEYDSNNNLVISYTKSGMAVSENRDFTDKEIVHFKTPNPKSFLYGKPVFYSGLMNIVVDEEVSKWIQAFFQNSLSGGAVFKQSADADVASRNRQWLKEEYTKAENAGKPIILEGDLELVTDSSKFRDLDYKALKTTSKEDILTHAGVPLSQAGVRSDSGQANIEVINAEEEAFIRNTVSHYHRIVFDRINQMLFRTIFDDDSLFIRPGLLGKFNNQNSIRFSEAGSKIALTINEHRELLGLQPIHEDNGGDIWVVSTNNGIVPASLIYGIDFNTGEKVTTLLEHQLGFTTDSSSKQDQTTDEKKQAENMKQLPGASNVASNLTDPTGGAVEKFKV